MDERPKTNFSYGMVQRALDEGRYDVAIALLTERIEAQPQDRIARLLLLLANMSVFGPAAFDRQIEELRSITDLSGNERHIVRRIFLVGFHHAEQEGQTIQKISYQRLIRRLMLGQPLDVSISEAREIEEYSDDFFAGEFHDTLPVAQPDSIRAESELVSVTPPPQSHLERDALLGAGVLIMIVLLILQATAPRPLRYAQTSEKPLVVASTASGALGALVRRSEPTVILPPTFTVEPLKQLIASQLGALNKAYARWSEGDPSTGGSVALKLNVQPSGKVLRVNEVVSRLSEHRFLDVILTEAMMWKLPHASRESAEISIPLLFVPGRVLPLRLAAEAPSDDPAAAIGKSLATHTNYALEDAEPLVLPPDAVVVGALTLKPHTLGILEPAGDTQVAAAAADTGLWASGAIAKQQLAASARISESETETARAAALKHEPRFAAEALEKVGLGTRVTVLRKERDWIKVKVQNSGTVGYLRKEYLTAFNSHR